VIGLGVIQAVAHVLGLRRRPGRLVLVVFRIPLPLYRVGLGWIFGHAFLLLVHRGRKSGRTYQTALKVLTTEPRSHEVIVFSAWGESSDWVRNIQAGPALEVRLGRERFVPAHRFLTEEEASSVVVAYRRRNPLRFRMLSWLLAWGDLRSDEAVRAFVRSRPFIALRPAEWLSGSAPRTPGR
jgi:deazaflavin-dependent oxidoreductase (nitroreductase family)